MNLQFKSNIIQIDDDPITAKIKETISFQKSYADELYRGVKGEDFDKGFLAGLEHALEIIKKNPIVMKEKIKYIEVPTNHVVIQRIYQKKIVPIEGEKVLRNMIKLCAEYGQILSDDVVKKHFGIDMNEIRKDLFCKDK